MDGTFLPFAKYSENCLKSAALMIEFDEPVNIEQLNTREIRQGLLYYKILVGNCTQHILR